ncbi:MAG: ABC transporter ATP-binding protein [Hyphomicrobiales bacterium]|nr:ABC transporter ATP-binding protein [Hyphomicrobiales bacterium]
MDASRPTAVEVTNLTKHYGSVVALDGVDLKIAAGEYFVLLGPSGGGKTTLLRTVGGFHRPTSGRVLLHGADVTDLPPDKRPTSMVFQSYALFPHMTVIGNVGYGLSLAKVPPNDIRAKSEAMLEMVGMKGYGERKPHELSGGQQQRVQLARSLVLDRDILLLDEPLAALDAQLRKDMCLELKHLQEKVGITFIHVTHNQEEAMTVADRIALIADGRLVEQGSARDVYEAPVKRFTASFVGENNLLDGVVASVSKLKVSVDVGAGKISVERQGQDVSLGDKVSVSIRSELLQLASDGGKAKAKAQGSIAGTFIETVYLGLTTSYRVALENGVELNVRAVSDGARAFAPKAGQRVIVKWQDGAARLHTN